MKGKGSLYINLLWSLCFLIVLLVNSCGSKDAFEPLPEAEMQLLLREMHIADAIAERGRGTLDWRKQIRYDLYDEILKQHGVDRDYFYASYRYYLAHPVEMDSLYEKLVKDLDRMLTEEIDKEKEDEIAKDRLRNMDNKNNQNPAQRPGTTSGRTAPPTKP